MSHDEELPYQPDPTLVGMGIGGQPGIGGKIALWVPVLSDHFVDTNPSCSSSTAILRAKIRQVSANEWVLIPLREGMIHFSCLKLRF